MAGASGNRATITTSGTFGNGAAVDVATLNRAQNVLLKTDGTATFQGNVTTPSQTCTGTITTLNLVAQKTGGGTGGDITAQGNLLVNGNATVDGDLLIKGTSEFSATVGGAGEVSIGDVDADTVNIKGDVLFNPTYAAATPPATVGPLTATQFILDQSEAKFGFFQFEPKSEVDITGRLHNTGDAFLASTGGETLHVNRDQETYNHAPGIVLDVGGNALVNGYIVADDGDELNPAFRFGSNAKLGLFAHNVGGAEYGTSFTNDSGRTFEINSGEFKFYRNAEFIKEAIGTTTITSGSGYTNGIYNNVAGVGGSGTGIAFNLTVAFGTAITTAGAGYTDATYTGVSLSSVSGAQVGALQAISITTAGNDYVSGTYTNVPLVGGSGSSGTVDVTVSGGSITNVVPNQVGSGYSQGDPVSVATANIGGSQLTNNFTITNGGSGYTDGNYLGIPFVNTSGSGSGGTANVTVSGGVVTDVQIGGSTGGGYTTSDVLTFNGSDLSVTVVDGLSIASAGSGYTNGTFNGVSLTGGSGTGLVADLTFTGNALTGAVITAPGGQGINYNLSETVSFAAADVGGNSAGLISGLSVTPVTVAVTVSTDTVGGQANGVFYFDGVESPSSFALIKGQNYIFDQSASSNASWNSQAHPLMFSAGPDGDHNGNGHYLDGVVYKLDGTTVTMAGYVSGFAAATTRVVEWAVPTTAPNTLYYWCHSHTGQGDSFALSTFTDGTFTGIALTGGSGTNATADIEVVNGYISNATINNAGSGYANSEILGITGYAASQVTITSLAGPVAASITISSISSGTGIAVSPTSVLTGSGGVLEVSQVATGSGGNGASIDLVVFNGAVTEAVVSNAGTGYSIGDTIRVNDADMLYDDGTGAILTSATPTQQMLFTITGLGEVTKVDIPTTAEGEGYKINDEITVSNSAIGSGGNGFKVTVNTLDIETTISLNERTGQLQVKEFDSKTLSIDNSLALTATGITKSTAGNLLLTALTDSFVQITGSQAFIVPTGNSTQRPTGVEGMIRYNSEVSQFEGYNGTSFVSLGGVRDVDLDTFVTAENTTNEDDDTFRFFNENINTIKLTKDIYSLNNVDEIEYTNIHNVTPWGVSIAVVSPFDVSTFDGSSASIVSTSANTITITNHNLTQGVIVTYSNGGGSDITGITDGTEYYVEVVDANTIQLAADAADLANDNFANFAAVGTGSSHTLTPVTASVVDILYYQGQNVYAVTGTGTFDADVANAPSHTTGAATNGTAQLTFRRTIYSDPVFKGNDLDYIVNTFGINTGSIRFSSTTTNAIINSDKDSLDIGFDDKVLFGSTKSGGIFVNTGYAAGTTANTEILDYELNEFTLKDTKVLSADATLDTSTGNATSLTFKPYTEGFSGKFMVEIKDNSATPKRQFSEISFLCTSDGASILFTEVSKIYTDVVLCDVSVDIVSNNITLVVQDSQNSSTVVYTVKAIHNSILA